MKELEPVVNNIKEFLGANNINVFLGSEPDICKIEWEGKDWQSFLKVLKAEEMKTAFLNVEKLEEEWFKEIYGQEVPEDFKQYIGKINSLSLFHIKDSIKYKFSMTTKWWSELQDVCALSKEVEWNEFIEKPEAEIIEQVMQHFKQEDKETSPIYVVFREVEDFLKNEYGFDEEDLRNDEGLQEKVGKIKDAMRKELEKLKKEEEAKNKEEELKQVNKLQEELFAWAKQHEFKKLTNDFAEMFLLERNIELSKTSRDLLKHKVNFKLKKQWLL